MRQVNRTCGDGSFLAVVYDAYDDPRFTPLVGAVEQVTELADVLRAFGYRPTLLANPDRAGLRTRLRAWSDGWAAAGEHRPAVVAWSGHALMRRGELRLISREAGHRPSTDDYLTAAEFARRALESGADQILVLLDTCHAGAGARAAVQEALNTMAEQTLPAPRRAWLGALAACQEDEEAEGGRGVLLETVLRTLRHGPTQEGRYRHEWSVRNKGVSGHTLALAVMADWSEDGQVPVLASAGRPEPVFRNPLWRPRAGEALVEHLVLAARGIDPTEEGWFFTGRRRLLGEITEWLAEGRGALLLLMGSAGCGKSAVAGRIAALSHPEERREIFLHARPAPGEPDPGKNSVDAALHLRGMSVQGLAEALAEKLGLPAPETPAGLIAELEGLEHAGARRHVLVLDGLDEAAPDQAGPIAEQLLVPLSRLCTVLLASRDRPFQPHTESGETLGAALTRAAGATVRVVDLDEEPDTSDDIAAYVRKRLDADGVPVGTAAEIAAELAGRAARGRGGFLFARIVGSALARGLSADPDRPWRDRIPDGIGDALAQDLAAGAVRHRDGGLLPHAAGDLLTALAWAAGTGMPAHGVWQAAAEAVSREGTSYGPEDIDWVLAHYGRYIVEDSDGEQAVYRLYHRELVAYLRDTDARRNRESPPSELAIVRALVALTLRQTGGGLRPEDANTYLREHLAEHAVVAGEEGVEALRGLAGVNSAAYLPELAVALTALALRLGHREGQGEKALHMGVEAVALHRELVLGNPALRPRLATSLNILSLLLAENGQREAGTAAAQESVRICRELSADSPAAHRANLANSLNSLANLLAEAERHDEALDLAEEALGLYRELSRTGPDVHRPGLAGTLVNLGLRRARMGKHDAALDALQEGTDLYRELSRKNLTAHRPELAAALSNLAGQFVDAGRHEEALVLAEEATACYRELAATSPAAHRPALALSLGNLAAHLTEFERHREALVLSQEAVALYRDLSETSPAAHRPALASALDRLARYLAADGRHDEALAVAEEGVRLHHELAVADPTAHRGGLADSLGQFSDRLADVGRHEEAVDSARQSVRIRSAQARTSLSVHGPDLASSLRTLAVRLAEAGREAEAVAPAAQSVYIRRQLVAVNPGAHLPQLATSLTTLTAVLPPGSPDVALPLAEEAVAIHRDLARTNPVVHRAGLADSLHKLAGQLAEAARYDEAVTVAEDAVSIYRELVRSSPVVYLPALATALGNLGRHLSDTGRSEAAVQCLEECLGILRPLCRTNPAAHLPDLVTALNNLAVDLTEAGRPEEAMAHADEVVRIRLDLALADPATHLDLLSALNNLALHLKAAGRPEEAVTRYREIIEAFRGQAHVASVLTCGLATLRLRNGEPAAVVDVLCPLLSGADDDLDPEITFEARRLLRRAAEADPPLREAVARRCGENDAAPDWLNVSEAALRLTESWLTTPTPAESRAFLLAHPELLTEECVRAVREWTLMNPAADERAERLERLVAGTPVDTVYRPLLLWTTVAGWFTGGDATTGSTDYWAASAAYLTAHAAELLTPEADQILAEMAALASVTAYVAGFHRAILGLAALDGIEPAYDLLRRPHALQDRISKALDTADARALEWLATLEANIFFAGWSGTVHWLTAQVLSGAPAPLDVLSHVPEQQAPTPADRHRAATEVAALLAAHPDKAVALGALLQAVLTPEPGQGTEPDRARDGADQDGTSSDEREGTSGA
ncbi:tetratricopeptide repeat protein [Streptomyces diastatochromogenes]|uniref:tetratricopeptide repeat protein n=1 Tax=Streptomyces diastatochromogenes TaxID=42236 RepID=UPI003659B84B